MILKIIIDYDNDNDNVINVEKISLSQLTTSEYLSITDNVGGYSYSLLSNGNKLVIVDIVKINYDIINLIHGESLVTELKTIIRDYILEQIML